MISYLSHWPWPFQLWTIHFIYAESDLSWYHKYLIPFRLWNREHLVRTIHPLINTHVCLHTTIRAKEEEAKWVREWRSVSEAAGQRHCGIREKNVNLVLMLFKCMRCDWPINWYEFLSRAIQVSRTKRFVVLECTGPLCGIVVLSWIVCFAHNS